MKKVYWALIVIAILIIYFFLPKNLKESENTQNISEKNNASLSLVNNNNLLPYSNISCEDIKPDLTQMRWFFFDTGGERCSNNGLILLKNGGKLMMSSGGETCEGSYEEWDKRDEQGNKINGYIITYKFEKNPDSCIYSGEQSFDGVWKNCSITKISCDWRFN